MTGSAPEWWQRPRTVSVVIDNPSWILPYGRDLVTALNDNGDRAMLCTTQTDIEEGDIAFYLGCIHLVPSAILQRNRRNLVVHESALPAGRGFSPLTWQILEGMNTIPICLFEASEEADAGPVIYRDTLEFDGHELLDELRMAQGRKTVELCLRFMHEALPPEGEPQTGQPSNYSRREPEDSRLDSDKTLAEQFDRLRVADNKRYPAFFEIRGRRYILKIEQADTSGNKAK